MSLTVTSGTLLGGRVRYDQPASGHRSGIEPVLLAASVPARAGERVLEGGTGAGAGLLCLAARVAGLRGVGVELDPQTAALARANIAANAAGGLCVLTGDLMAAGELMAAGPVDHAFANPPWHDGPPSAEPRRALARTADPGGLLDAWCRALAAPLRRGGTLTLVLPAAQLCAGVAAMRAQVGGIGVLPLWPRAGRPARLLLLRGRRGLDGEDRVLPGLVLHGPGGYTPAAEAVLRGGGTLDWG